MSNLFSKSLRDRVDPTLQGSTSDPLISAPSPFSVSETSLCLVSAMRISLHLPVTSEQSLSMRPKREELLRRGLKPLEDRYDFMVLDCPPTLGVLTEAGIAAADFVVIPCQMEARAADGLVDLLEVISIIKGEDFAAWGILLTKFDKRKSATNQAILTALARWQEKIFRTTIPQSEPLNQAQIVRSDIYSFDGKSAGAVAYHAFTQEVLTHGQ